jgi:hypothetical protein
MAGTVVGTDTATFARRLTTISARFLVDERVQSL